MWFKRKDDENQLVRLHGNLKMAFNKVDGDINHLRAWTSYLYSRHQEMEKKHESHIALTQKDIENLNSWIKMLHSNSVELHKYFKETTEHLIDLHKKDKDLLEKIMKIEQEIATFRSSPVSPVRTKSELKSELKSEPSPASRNQFELRVLEAVRPNRKVYILEQIIKVAQDENLSTKQIEKIIVHEKKLCGRTAFYDYLRELRLKKRLRKKEMVEEKEE